MISEGKELVESEEFIFPSFFYEKEGRHMMYWK